MSREIHSPDYLLELRQQLFRELEEAETALSAARLQVERIESDLRIGAAQPAEYGDLKGRTLPQAEARVLDLYRDLWKLEDRINAARGR
jgi:hypothetical protein